jgi:hypothetical protein
MMRNTGIPRRRNAPPARRATGNHRDEFGQGQDLVENAVAAQHQRRAEGDEVAGDMSDEQAAQAEEAHRIDKAAVEGEQ